eukprot:TRINITY_DN21426_c0_g1_i1.p1 TRINITY_DN21426_c0_g1~~TRINITY_DN21426_c0_g1_i1.p1  ORF type:complete len:268 (-),score=36.30 TRINITY_DN21426_c0_g1_i1:1430-2233(-)
MILISSATRRCVGRAFVARLPNGAVQKKTSSICAAYSSVPEPAWDLRGIAEKLASRPRKKLKSVVVGRRAAVLIPLCLEQGTRSPAVLLNVRSSKLRNHAGEICFPGGACEESDRDAAATALREAEEEIGIAPNNVQVLGQMSPVLSKNGVAVDPVVAFVSNGSDGCLDVKSLSLDEEEVAGAFILTTQHLLAADTLTWHELEVPRKSMPLKIPAFRLSHAQSSTLPSCARFAAQPPGACKGELSVWGLTGFLLHSLLFDVLKKQIP